MMEGKTGSRATRFKSHPVAIDSAKNASLQSHSTLTNGFDTRTSSVSTTANGGVSTGGVTATLAPVALDQERSGTEAPRLIRDSTQDNGNVLRDCVEQSLNRYFKDLNGQRPEGLYNLVVGEIEYPLLTTVMRECDQNQSRAAKVLGINRNTLRKKLKLHGLV